MSLTMCINALFSLASVPYRLLPLSRQYPFSLSIPHFTLPSALCHTHMHAALLSVNTTRHDREQTESEQGPKCSLEKKNTEHRAISEHKRKQTKDANEYLDALAQLLRWRLLGCSKDKVESQECSKNKE